MPLTGKRAAFYALIDSHDALIQVLDEEMMAEFQIPLDWYDVLIKLWLAPGGSLRMSELASRVLLSRSWITRRVVQLEEAGLVSRAPDTGTDRRGVTATLTRQGRAVFEKLERAHAKSIEQHFSTLVTAEESEVIRRALSKVAAEARRLRAEAAKSGGAHESGRPEAAVRRSQLTP